jgi:hypothetical protein
MLGEFAEEKSFATLPAFPKTKIFNSMSPVFLEERMRDLKDYFSAFINHPKLHNHDILMLYFQTAAFDKKS